MGYLIIDTETTGLTLDHLPADAPEQPRMASCALLFINDVLELEHEWNGLIKPDGWTMPAEVERINICTMVHGRRVCGRGSLAFVHETLCGAKLTDAHSAHADAHACLRVLRELARRVANPSMLVNLPRAAA